MDTGIHVRLIGYTYDPKHGASGLCMDKQAKFIAMMTPIETQ